MNEAGAAEIVSVVGLGRRFKKKVALDGVDFEVKAGTVHGLVGENGAGKTTLIKHLLGTYRAQSGTVRVFGKDPSQEQVAVLAQLGYLSEDRDLPGWMRVRELMRYTQAFYPDWDESYGDSLCERFRLDREARIKQMSRGEKAKVGLVCALAYRPTLLLLDEPSSGLDVTTRRDILWAIVRTVADEGRTVIFSSHLLDEVDRAADSITLLHQGKTVLEGPLLEMKEQHPVLDVSYSDSGARPHGLPGILHVEGSGREYRLVLDGPPGAPFQEALRASQGEVLQARPATLEELFLARTGATPAAMEG